ncbi:hypothetical protein NM688_g323 [Phlebia brevispora]|uniref:Uncharacterized protein n=1 Tax=Phlebia brevispora TaxID=194682 RepID=A0ACC1TEN0_9APHY|nr:hypothetical protein NM688_g323 [Phlebia brevispora]
MNKETSLLECITPSKDIHAKWSNMFVPHKAPKLFHERVRTCTFTPEELALFREDWLLRVAELNLKSQLLIEERRHERLIDHISNSAPPLIDCITLRNEYIPPAPPAKELKFCKTKILARIKEFEPVLEVTKTQLDLFFAKLRNEDSREDLGLSFDIPAELDNLKTFWHNGKEMAYQLYAPNTTLGQIGNWHALLEQGVDLTVTFTSEESRSNLHRIFENASRAIVKHMAGYTNKQITDLNAHVASIEKETADLQATVRHLAELVITQGLLIRQYQATLDKVRLGQGTVKCPKLPDPPKYAGTVDKQGLEDWLNQIILYNEAYGISDDQAKILTALTHLQKPAMQYMATYFNNVKEGKDLDTWNNFIKELRALYGKRDNKKGAKEEITQLWANKALAKKDFIKYAEQYRTLARIVKYEDKLHIDKLWEDEYLDLLLKVYKVIYSDKSCASVFDTSSSNGSSKDPDAMEIDAQAKSKGKGKEHQANSTETKKETLSHLCCQRAEEEGSVAQH